MTSTATTDERPTLLRKDTLDHVRRNGGFTVETPGPDVHHLRRGLHLALAAEASRVAEHATEAAAACRNRYATLDPAYESALGRLARIRALLENEVGWAGSAAGAPVYDLSIATFAGPDFGIFYEAVTLAAADGEPGALPAVLDAMCACINDAETAHNEWISRPQGTDTAAFLARAERDRLSNKNQTRREAALKA